MTSPFLGHPSPADRASARAVRARVATWILVTPIAALVVIGLVIGAVAVLRGREAAQRKGVADRAAFVVERSRELARATPDAVPTSLARLRPDASYFVLSRSGDGYGHSLLMRRCAAEAAPEEMLEACAGATHVVVVRDREVFVFDLETKHLRGGVVLPGGGEHDADAVVDRVVDAIGGRVLR